MTGEAGLEAGCRLDPLYLKQLHVRVVPNGRVHVSGKRTKILVSCQKKNKKKQLHGAHGDLRKF